MILKLIGVEYDLAVIIGNTASFCKRLNLESQKSSLGRRLGVCPHPRGVDFAEIVTSIVPIAEGGRPGRGSSRSACRDISMS
jgi:hypothetical protein